MKTLVPPPILTGEELKKQEEKAKRLELQRMIKYPQTLKNKLNEYSGDVLSDDFIRYLNALINLEENLLKNKDISDKRVEIIESIELLKQIVTYNVFCCVRRTLQNAGIGNLQEFYDIRLELSAEAENGTLLFDSNFNDPIHPYFEIHTLIESAKRRGKRLKELKEELEKEMSKTNPYEDWGEYYRTPSGRSFGGLSRPTFLASDYDIWNANHNQKIQRITEEIQQLENRRDLTLEEIAYSEQSQKVAQAFRNEYEITDCGEEMEYNEGTIIGKKCVNRDFGTILIKSIYH